MVQTVPLRVNDAGGGFAPVWAPTYPMLTVLPLSAARFAFHPREVATTAWPVWA